jgi:hypothetical protein
MEKLFEYGDAKFKVVLQDDIILDPITGKVSQLVVPAEVEKENPTTQLIYLYKTTIYNESLLGAVICAVQYQFQLYKLVNSQDQSVNANDYFWNIEDLMRIGIQLYSDLKDLIKELEIEFVN